MSRLELKPRTSVSITLGGGVDPGIRDNDDHLVMTDYTGYQIDLGKATKRRFKNLLEYVNRMKIHAVD